MTFLNPLVFLGLAAAAIPLLLHILNRRKLRTVQFSSLQFLTDLQRTAIRRLKIRQLLLMMLRTLIITVLVFAFSRPVLRGSHTAGIAHRAATTMVFLLDDSPSMGIRTERGLVLSEVASAALRILDVAGPDDHLCLVTLSSLRTDSVSPPLVTLPSAVREKLRQTAPSTVSGTIHAALPVARQVLARSSDPNKELYILTDGQASQFPAGDGRTDSAAASDDQTRCFVIQPPPPPDDNLSVHSAELKTRIIIRDRPVTLEAVIRNDGSRPSQNSIASFYLDGVRVAQQSISLPPHTSFAVTGTVIPKRAGTLGGFVELEDDPLEIDNRRFFALPVPEKVRVLVCSPTAQDGRFPLLALTLGGDSTVAGLFEVRQETEQSLPALDLTAFDVLVLCGLSNIGSGNAARVAQFVRSGGGVVLFPSSGAGLEGYNQHLFPALRMPQAVFTRISSGTREEVGSFLSFSSVDLAHPLFAGMFETDNDRKGSEPPIRSPRVTSVFAPQPGGTTVIGLSNGAGFLREYGYGSGRVLAFAVEPGTLWSDFPTTGIYAPLLHRTVLYLVSPAAQPRSFTSGDRLEAVLRAPVAAGAVRFFFRNPSGIDERTEPRLLPASILSLFRSGPTDTVGLYTLRQDEGERQTGQGGKVLSVLPVNVSPHESDLRTISDDEFSAFFVREGIDPARVVRVRPSDDAGERIREARFGLELWRYLLALALLLAIVEMVVARDRTDGKAPTA